MPELRATNVRARQVNSRPNCARVISRNVIHVRSITLARLNAAPPRFDRYARTARGVLRDGVHDDAARTQVIARTQM